MNKTAPNRFHLLLLLPLLFGGSVCAEEQTPPHAQAKKGMFAQFVGVCQAGADDGEIWRHISFVRTEPGWGTFQPDGPDQWHQQRLEAYGQSILENRKHGVEVLVCLDYMRPWAARRKAWTFTVENRRYDVAAFHGTEYKRKVTITDLNTGKQSEVQFDTGRMPPENVADWENFIERVVSFLSKPPYNVEYFQIWNEANDAFTGFWTGGMDEYMTTIHLPAARIIRKYGAKVVYGGYPCNGSMAHFLGVLDKHQAWDTLDVLDIHYFPLSSWQVLHDQTRHKNRKFAIWQTEVGFTTSRSWVPNNYPRFFHWALTHDWQPDRYKFFQFAYGSPDDPKAYGYECSFMLGNRLSHHGKALGTLGELLDAPKVEPYPHWRTNPVLRTEINENKSSIEAFHCGDRIVLAVHMADQNRAAIFTDWNGTLDNMHLEWDNTRLQVLLPRLQPDGIAGAWRVGIYGSRLPLEILPHKIGDPSGGVKVMVPTMDGNPQARQDNRASTMHTFYLLLTLAI